LGDADFVGNVHGLIAFDLDGTLIDSRRDLADAANDLIVELGGLALAEEAIAAMVGEGAALLVRRALAAAALAEPPDAVSRFLAFYDARLLNYTRPYPGVLDVVRLAREYGRVAVLTNKPKLPTERILAGLGIRDLFDDVVGGDGPLPRKPDPAALFALMNSADASIQTTLLVGDSPIDFRTARNAGTRCCLVSFGFGFRGFAAGEPDASAAIAADADELAHIIREFAGGPVS
jgi:phosphoglycolate phosphatase